MDLGFHALAARCRRDARQCWAMGVFFAVFAVVVVWWSFAPGIAGWPVWLNALTFGGGVFLFVLGFKNSRLARQCESDDVYYSNRLDGLMRDIKEKL